MLKSRFWKHLNSQELKNATRLAYETCRSFEELRIKIRREEQELKTSIKAKDDKSERSSEKKEMNVHQINKKSEEELLLKDLMEKVKLLGEKLDKIEKQREASHDKSTEEPATRHYADRGRSWYRGNWYGRSRGYYGSSNRRNPYGQRNAYDDSSYQDQSTKARPNAQEENTKQKTDLN